VADVKVRISCSVKILYLVLSGISIAVFVEKVNIHISISERSPSGYEKGLHSSCVARCIERVTAPVIVTRSLTNTVN
jgi:hypothetical protein